MTLYSQIANNRLKTWLIMSIFIFIFSGFFYLIGQYYNNPGYLTLGLVISIFSSLCSYFYSDKLVLWTNRAVPANKKQFFNYYTVAENMTIAAGLPMPKLYVINDPSPNAFATGRDSRHAVICVTTGLLQILNRSELEGVISHELSHIKNYDILLSAVIATLVGTIALISDWIMRSFWWGSRDRDENNRSNPLMFIFVIISLIITPLAATLIQLAISRKREFLADASGAMLTRNPVGLASALEKISAFPYPMRNISSSTAHLFIANPFKKTKRLLNLSNLFASHPPIEERIRILRSL